MRAKAKLTNGMEKVYGRKEKRKEKRRKKEREEKEWQDLYKKNKKTSKPAANTARNKKAMIIAFLFRCYKTADAQHTQFYIQGENWGHGGKERAIGPFFSPVAVLKVLIVIIIFAIS